MNSNQPTTWQQRLAERWWKTKLADNALQIAKDARRQQVVERLIRKTQDGTLGSETADWSLDDDMGVQVGDNMTVQVQQPLRTGGVSRLLFAAALLASGGGVGALAAWAATSLVRPNPSAIVPTASDHRDADTRYEFGLVHD